MLEFCDVSRHFGELKALDGVSLKIGKAEMIGVIGRSGAGKSTLLRTVNRLCEPSGGDILWDGDSVLGWRGAKLRDWRHRCAMIFQHYNLVPRLDVITNVLMGALPRRPSLSMLAKSFPRADRARAILELDRLGVAEKALVRAQLLSGGQQQRVAIARAMMQSPDIVLADEPVASLDPLNAEIVMRALQTINQTRDITVMVNLHALDIARRYCTRVIGMSAGRIVFDGPVSALDDAAVARIYSGSATGVEGGDEVVAPAFEESAA